MTSTSTVVSTQPSVAFQPQLHGKIAVVKADKNAEMFTCVVDGITIGSSKHKDYFEFHKRRGDIVRLAKLPISKFIYIDNADQVLNTVKIEGAPSTNASVARAITLAKEPAPAQSAVNDSKGAIAKIKEVSKRLLGLDDLELARENGRKGARKAAELRAQVFESSVKVVKIPGKPGRPRKIAAVN
jgi:hypothetical protein